MNFAGEKAPHGAGVARLASALMPVLLALALHLAGAAGAAAQTGVTEDRDDAGKTWQEMDVQLPAPPRPENLVPVRLGPTATLSFTIDAASLSVGRDGVVRFTLVAASSGGARNVTYEGLRCRTHERKLYAIGQLDGSWSHSRRNQWDRAQGGITNPIHATLARDYFCAGRTVAGTAEEMIDRIRNERSLASSSYR